MEWLALEKVDDNNVEVTEGLVEAYKGILEDKSVGELGMEGNDKCCRIDN